MNLSQFLSDALIGGYANGSFTTEQVIIFSQNYLNRGQITADDHQRVMDALFPPETEV